MKDPLITIRKRPQRCLIQVNCPQFRQEELSCELERDWLILSGNPLSDPQETTRPAQFEYRISLDFNASNRQMKSVFLDGVFSVLIKEQEMIAL
jgi:HSP20 family molecular chaperone IbpA